MLNNSAHTGDSKNKLSAYTAAISWLDVPWVETLQALTVFW